MKQPVCNKISMSVKTMMCLSVVVVVMMAQVVTAAPSSPMETHTELENDIRDEQYFEDLFHRQQMDLKSLGCRPMMGKVTVESQLQFHDQLADKLFFPQVVSIARCHEDCSFCGDHRHGVNRGRCQAEGVAKRTVVVFYLEKGIKRYREVMITEHTSCKCV